MRRQRRVSIFPVHNKCFAAPPSISLSPFSYIPRSPSSLARSDETLTQHRSNQSNKGTNLEMAWYSGGLKGYWKRRPYQRMDFEGGTGGRRLRRSKKVVLGGGKRQRIWRIKVSPRLRFLRVLSPKRLIAGIRDAYVRMMLAFASSGAIAGYGGDGFGGFNAPPVKEYDERMIIEIYKSLMTEGKLIAASGVGGVVPSSKLVVRR
ncbi:uncharacterized protein LOC110033120 [Phalaenopsis equestris]|uniref:uncharacterized protein LOC110033120 n=1 Tax=Phalaenopsis equestris TaxID=78828 RepID=UPI0009E1DD52|nr:uncharacterized protein LOC110033120 [Phalaenopsis equestris]